MTNSKKIVPFIRGGQIVSHYIAMGKQVIKTYVKYLFFIYVAVFLVSFFVQTDHRQRGYAFDYFLSDLSANKLSMGSVKVSVYTNGTYRAIPANQVLRNRFFKNRFNEVVSAIKISFYFATSSIFILAIIVLYLIRRKGDLQLKKDLIRGASLVKVDELELQIKKYIKSDNYKRYGICSVAGIRMPSDIEVKNILVIGDQGVKKTQILIENALNFRKSGKKAIIYDPSGDLIRYFYREGKDYILNPLDERSVSWNIWNECKKEYQLHSLTNSFISNSGEEYKNDFFIMAARIVFINLVKRSDNIEDLKLLIKGISLDSLTTILSGTDAGIIIDKDGARAAHSVRAVLLSHVDSLFSTQKMKGDIFSIYEWVRDFDNEDSFLFISCPPPQLRMLKPLLTLWLDVAFNSILSLNPDDERRIATILDEVVSLNKLDSLSDFLAQARKYGNITILGFQNISQARVRYGINGAKEITGLCGNWVCFRSSEYENAKWISDNLYSEDVVEKNENTSFGSNSVRDGVSINSNRAIRNLVTPTEIQSLYDGFAYYRISGGFSLSLVERSYIKLPKISDGLIEIDDSVEYISNKKNNQLEPQTNKKSSDFDFTNIDIDIDY